MGGGLVILRQLIKTLPEILLAAKEWAPRERAIDRRRKLAEAQLKEMEVLERAGRRGASDDEAREEYRKAMARVVRYNEVRRLRYARDVLAEREELADVVRTVSYELLKANAVTDSTVMEELRTDEAMVAILELVTNPRFEKLPNRITVEFLD